MPRGDKSKYTDKQERKADHIAESYEERGVSEKEAERRAWATVNKDDGGGKETGGFGPRQDHRSSSCSRGRKEGRRSICVTLCSCAISLSQKGCRDAKAKQRPWQLGTPQDQRLTPSYPPTYALHRE